MNYEQQDTYNEENHTPEEIPTQETPPLEEKDIAVEHTASHNMIIVAVLAVVVVVLALMYMWGSSVQYEEQVSSETAPMEPTPAPTTDPQTETLKEVGSSDEIQAIENDLNATELEAIDAEVEQIEAEIEKVPAE